MAFSGPALAAYAGIAAAGATVYSAETAKSGQKRALRQQGQAQSAAEGAAAKQQRESQANIAAANQKKPDIAKLLASAQSFGGRGLSSTNLTGPLRTPLGGGG